MSPHFPCYSMPCIIPKIYPMFAIKIMYLLIIQLRTFIGVHKKTICLKLLEMCIRDREKLNEGFLRLDPILFGKGAMANSGVAVVYNVFIKIRIAWVDPEFDYGRCFNYKETKWTSLLNNYIDFNLSLIHI